MSWRKAIRTFGAACVLLLARSALAQEEFTLGEQGWQEQEVVVNDPDLVQARKLLAADKPEEALPILDEWIKAHKYSEDPDLPQAYLIRGDAKLMAGNEYKALYDYEAVIKQFFGSPAFPKAVEREEDIAARYVTGLRRKWFFGWRVERAETLGEELLIRVQERMPGSQLAEMAALKLADFYYRKRELGMAAEMYGIFVETYPDSKYRKFAALRQIYANIASYKGPKYDRSALVESKLLIERFQNRYPADAEQAGVTAQLTAWVDESAAEHLLDTAMWYLRRGDEASARFTMQRLVRSNPQTAAAAKAAAIMQDKGWLDQAPQAPAQPVGQEPVDEGS